MWHGRRGADAAPAATGGAHPSRPPRISPDTEEAIVANKDKGSQAKQKKKAQHNLKEKRAAKKTKRGTTTSSSTMSPS